MYDNHLGLIGKRVVDFLLGLLLIELFSIDVTAEASVQNLNKLRSETVRDKMSVTVNH